LRCLLSLGCHSIRCHIRLGLLFVSTDRDFFHEHENLVDPSDIFLNLSDIVLEYSCFHTLSASQALHNACIFISDISFNDILDSFNLIKTVIEAHDLAD
jgi:hypothetical protein